MSKNYVVNCYTCQHNGQETCKGCRTLLVGEDEPYENWQLREDLETKDQKIADLEAKLAESEKSKEINIKERDKICLEMATDYNKQILELKRQLAEKDKEIENLKETSDKNIDYLIEFASLIENEKDCNRMLKALSRVKEGKKYIIDKETQDKISFAVERLEKVKELAHNHIKEISNDLSEEDDGRLNQKHTIHGLATAITDIDNQIEELKKGVE